jgi:hypothetical protein
MPQGVFRPFASAYESRLNSASVPKVSITLSRQLIKEMQHLLVRHQAACEY